MDLNEKIIFISGGSQGIGLATGIKLKEHGARIIVNGRNEQRLHEVEKEHGFLTLPGDVSNEKDVRSMFKIAMNHFGRIDALINNAGYGYFQRLEEIDTVKFNQLFATNVTGAMLMAREAVEIFKKQNSGNIVNISSTAGTKGFIGGSAYSATKFALRAMTQCWQAELRQHNIRVILINPSEVQTHFSINAGGATRPHNPSKLQAEDIAHAICTALQMDDRGFIPELTVFATNPQ